MHKLLVAIDSSDAATRALDYALKLAGEIQGVQLLIAYAHAPPVVYGEIAVYMSEDKARELQERHGQDILRPAIERAEAGAVSFTTEVLVGDVPSSLVKCAEGKGCDGIVMGTRGLSAIGNLVMGSVATKVIHLTKLPVTLVK
jgi:nucleotide-binding universal stress UspA family protein